MKIGYARVSTDDQKTGIQHQMLKDYGCEEIFEDKISGIDYVRKGLDACLAKVQEGDELVVIALDRMGRSMLETVIIVVDLDKRGISFVSLRERYFDTSNPIGRGILALVAAIAEDERIKIKARTKAGIRAYIRETGQWGRKLETDDEESQEVIRLLNEGLSIRKIQEKTGVDRGRVFRISKRLKREKVGDFI